MITALKKITTLLRQKTTGKDNIERKRKRKRKKKRTVYRKESVQ
tara:strand:+ start:319 stop:450 length:132 start_codon:yes stop_codon:yes gene_type:complete